MAITVDTDTYISLADANTYVTTNYVSTSAEAVAWTALSDANKEIYLKKATKKIDRQPLRGIKSVSTQTLEFPRAIWSETNREDYPVLHLYFDTNWYVQTETPQEVKDAQVEEALALAVGIDKRTELQRAGVKSFTLGKLSEQYGSPGNTQLLSHEAKELLLQYLAGSVRIC